MCGCWWRRLTAGFMELALCRVVWHEDRPMSCSMSDKVLVRTQASLLSEARRAS